MLFILFVSLIWGCQNFEMSTDGVMGDNLIMTGGDVITQIQPYTDPEIPLVDKHGQQIGNLIVFNTLSNLVIDFLADEDYTIDNVQLWVGIDPSNVPGNKHGIPTPGKFPYKASDQQNYEFNIKLSDIMTDFWELIDGAQSIVIFAHAEMENKQTYEKESVWSAGASFETSRWGSYSEFICQSPGGGCFPHFSICGNDFEGVFYYDNTLDGEQKKQSIFSDTGEEIGIVEYDEGKLYFLVNGNWSILDWEGVPPLTFRCFSEPGGEPDSDITFVDELENGKSMGYYAVVPESNYYLLDLKIQYCDY